jgi:hypothetical protein
VSSIYYIGGPWDLHKTPFNEHGRSGDVLYVAEIPKMTLESVSDDTKMNIKEHRYDVRQIADDTFIAIWEGLA